MLFRTLLAALLCLIPVAAHADWYEASSAHFVIYSEQSPDRIKDFATKLERFDRGFRRLRNAPDGDVPNAQRVVVFVINRTEDILRLARNDNVGGFYKVRPGGPVAIVPRYALSTDKDAATALNILLHEYAHHLMWTISPNTAYPSWLIEGFAEFNSTAKFESDGSVMFGLPPMGRASGLSGQYLLPLEKMFAADTLKLTQNETYGLYSRGWLLTHYLAVGAPERKGQLTRYIDAINDGTPAVKAAAAFGDPARLDAELERYKAGRMNALVLHSDQLPITPITIRKLSSGAEAAMGARISVAVGMTQKEATDALPALVKLGVANPDDAETQMVLSEVAIAAHDARTAEAAADRAIAADAKLLAPRILKAKIHYASVQVAKDRTPESWVAVRRTIAAANQIDPDNPEILAMFYRSYISAGQRPSATAQAALEHAFRMAPYDPSLRFNAASMILARGEKDRARAMLAPLAFAPHQRGSADRAIKLIAEIDAGKAAEALKELEGASGTQSGQSSAASSSAP